MEEMNFDEMRSQIAILKAKLDSQDIINDRMMHQVVSSKANNMKRVMLVSIACGLFVIAISPLAFHKDLGASWAFVIATDIMMIYCMTREFLFKHKISDKTLMNASLLEVAKHMRKFKVGYKRYTLSNIPILFIWVIWLLLETLKGDSLTKVPLIAGLIIGMIIGSAIGLKMYFRIQHEASDIISQIEE